VSKKLSEIVELYTDGACRGNPGVGGWGVVLQTTSGKRELSGVEENTTNNRMELVAAIQGLKALSAESRIRLYTDSQYVHNGITNWILKWKVCGWKTASGKPVKNQELWVDLDSINHRHSIEWHWVRGHAGNLGNERADTLANQAIDRFLARD
jgi:ribonuclease HI